MKITLLALALILVAALWRIATVCHPVLFNVAPVTALAFCAAVYLRDWRWWLVPFVALTLSDLWLNQYHATQFGYTWSLGEMGLRAACFAGALGLGCLVAQRRNVLTLAVGALGSSLIFYVGTNSVSWFTDPFYARTVAGWAQSLTVGHPEFPPTLWFFRNTLLGDLLFTAIFATAFKFATGRETAGARMSRA
jgi:hypothetical protein